MPLPYVLAVAATGRHGAQGKAQPDNQAWDAPRAAHPGSKDGGHAPAHLKSQEGGILSVSGMQIIVSPPLGPGNWALQLLQKSFVCIYVALYPALPCACISFQYYVCVASMTCTFHIGVGLLLSR